MSSYLDVMSATGIDRVELVGGRVTIGRSPGNDVVLTDSQTSRLHAVVDLIGVAWCIRDISSRNGTYLNGGRVTQQIRLTTGDEIRIGRVRLAVHIQGRATDLEVTLAQRRPPRLTNRERDVLLALCLPVLRTGPVTAPATLQEIATSLLITTSGARQHLENLFAKFGIEGRGDQRRTRLANAAVGRGAITFAEVRAAHEARAVG